MKQYKVTYSDHITKDTHTKRVSAENKREARKRFNDMWYAPYPIISIEEEK